MKVTINRQPSTRAERKLELIHSDLAGPLPESWGRSRYFIIYIDDYSRMTWLYTLQTKSAAEIGQVFEQFRAIVEQSDPADPAAKPLKISRLRSDNGTGEYTNRQFQNVLKKAGITSELTAPYTQHQNGVSERKIQTIQNMVRSMLHGVKLSYEFWAEAAATAAYLINRSPTAALNGMTPYEAWFGKKPSFGHIRVWGCPVHVHIPSEKRKKYDPRSKEGIFVGYVHQTSKLWRIFDPTTKKVTNAANVVFDEAAALKSKQEVNALQPVSRHTDLPTAMEVDRIVELPDEPHEQKKNNESQGKGYNEGLEKGVSDPIQDNIPADPEQLPDAEGRYKSIKDKAAHSSTCATANSEEACPRGGPTPQSMVAHSSEAQIDCDAAAAAIAPSMPRSNNKPATRAPTSYREAMASEECEQWQEAMDEEYNALTSMCTWELVDRPTSRVPSSSIEGVSEKASCSAKNSGRSANVIGCRWVYNIKVDADGGTRYKARLVGKGFQQIEGEDYDRTFAPVARLDTFRLLIALAAKFDWDIDQLDVVTAFLNGTLDEKERVYMEQPEGYETRARELVCMLLRSLYGLKQAPRVWNSAIDQFLRSIGFQPSRHDGNLYILRSKDDPVYLLLWVDDMLIFAKKKSPNAAEVKAKLKQQYRMKDLGPARIFIGIEISRDRQRRTITLSQKRYVESTLEQLGMATANGVHTPADTNVKMWPRETDPGKATETDVKLYQHMVGKINYAMTCTRPDLAFTGSLLGRFNADPSSVHASAAKRSLRYLRQTLSHGLTYGGDHDLNITGYSDSDYANDLAKARSTTGYIFLLNGAAIAWKSCRQQSTARSVAEAEYMALSDAAALATWLRWSLAEILDAPPKPIHIQADNTAALTNALDNRSPGKMKHINVRFHTVRDDVSKHRITLSHVASAANVADILTKPLPRDKHEQHMAAMGVHAMHG